MIAGRSGEFEDGFGKEGSTKEHMTLANTLGVKRMICCVNKMDVTTPPYSEKRFLEIQSEVKNYFKIKGFYKKAKFCLLYTSPSPRDKRQYRMPSSA